MRIIAKPFDMGTKLEVCIVLYGQKNSDGTVPTKEFVEVMSNAEWAAFKRLSDTKKRDLIKRVGTAETTEEVLLGNSPLLDAEGKTAAEYDADYTETDGVFEWAI